MWVCPTPVSGLRTSQRRSGCSKGWLRNDTERPEAVASSSTRSSAWPARTQSTGRSWWVDSTAIVGVRSKTADSRTVDTA